MMRLLESYVEDGWRVVGGSVSPKDVALNEVLRGTPTRLRPLVERLCTELVRISGNMPNDIAAIEPGDDDAEGGCFRYFLSVESLNVSVAAGLFLHQLIGNNKASA